MKATLEQPAEEALSSLSDRSVMMSLIRTLAFAPAEEPAAIGQTWQWPVAKRANRILMVPLAWPTTSRLLA